MDEIRLIELLKIDFENLSISQKRELKEYHDFLFGACNCKCKNKSLKYYQKLKTDGINMLEKKNNPDLIVSTTLFNLREDVCITAISFAGGTITKNDCQDDVAIAFLRENPNRISLFGTFPDNWRELILVKNDDDVNED